MDECFYIIDRNTKLSIINQEQKANLKLNMFMTFSSLLDNAVGTELNKYFATIIPDNNKDLLSIMISFSKSTPKKIQLKKDGVYAIIHNMISKNYCKNNTLELNEYSINDIGRILTHSIINEFKNYKIKSYEVFEELLTQFHLSTNNIIEEYEIYKKKIVSLKKNPFDLYKETKQKAKALTIPIELAFVAQKLSSITKLKLKYANVPEETFNFALMILLNSKLLFPNVKHIEMDLSQTDIFKDLYQRYHFSLSQYALECRKLVNLDNEKFFTKQWDFHSNRIEIPDDSKKICYNKSKTGSIIDSTNDLSTSNITTDKSITSSIQIQQPKKIEKVLEYAQIIIKNKKLLELEVIYPFFVSQWANLSSLQIISPYNFAKEIEELMQLNYNVLLMNYHYLLFFNSMNHLRELSLDFNSLDGDSFEKIMSIINNNSKLESLSLSFFSNDLYYLPPSLFQLMNKLKININQLLKQSDYSNSIISHQTEEETNKILINSFLAQFEVNMEQIFWQIKGETHIKNLNLFMVTPSIITFNQNYSMICMKFFLNCLILLNSNKAKYNTVKLIAPYFCLNNTSIPSIDTIFENINYSQHNCWLSSLTIQIQFCNIKTISHCFSYKLIEIKIGDLDKESFTSLITDIANPYFTSKSSLEKISLSLNGKVNQFDLIKRSLILYFTLPIGSLKEIELISYLFILPEQFNLICEEINYNSIQRYTLTLSKACLLLYNSFPSLQFIDSSKDKNMKIFSINAINKKYNISQPYKFYQRLMSYLMTANTKDLLIHFK